MEIWRWVRCQWDRVAAFVAFVTGLVALLLGWLGISDATLPSQQIPYLASETVFGLFALGTAATLWLSADLRDEWRVLDDIRRAMVEQAGDVSATSRPTVPAAGDVTDAAANGHVERRAVAVHGRVG